MNKYARAIIVVPTGLLKSLFLKLFHPIAYKGVHFSQISPFTEITLDRGGKLSIGKNFKMREGSKIRVRKDGNCMIGAKTSLGGGNIITCRKNIIIGDNVQLSPNVLIYDHDHDFKTPKGISDNKFLTGDIIIGNNVWIGAGSIILMNTEIGDNSVIAAGSVVKGRVPPNSVFIQKREKSIKKYELQ